MHSENSTRQPDRRGFFKKTVATVIGVFTMLCPVASGLTVFSVDRKSTVVKRANKTIAARNEIDKTAGVWTNDIEGFHCFFACAPQINRANRHLGKFVPGIDTVGDDAKYTGHAVDGQRLECCHANGAGGG